MQQYRVPGTSAVEHPMRFAEMIVAEATFGGDFSHLECANTELAVRKILHRPGDAADTVGLHGLGIRALANNHFC